MKSLSFLARIFLVLGLIAMLAPGAFAHTYLSSVYLGGEALTEGDCVRPHPSTAFDSPIPLVTAPDMTCGWLPYAANPANRKCPIAAGSSIGIQWHHNSAASTDDIIDVSHLGPVIVYLAKSDTGAGNVWFKIYEDGYTASDGQWAVNRLVNNKGRVDVTIPSDIAPGNYLLRGEVLALHNGYALDGVQPYVGCVELTISGSGSANPAGVAFPGAYVDTDPGLLFNIYQAFTSYPIPGPALYKSGSSSSSSSSSGSSATSAPTSKPTQAPSTTSAPSTPAPTTAPTTKPTSTTGSSSSSGSNIKVQLNQGTSEWWLGVAVLGGSETTVKVEMTDSGSVSSWTSLVDMSYAYVFDGHAQIKAPISLRLTSSSGKQVTLTNVFTSFTSALVDTGMNYGSSSSAPASTTSAPTAAPTTKPTTKPSTTGTPAQPTNAPAASTTGAPASGSGSNVKVTVHQSANPWWFAVAVSGNSGSISNVEIKDSGAVSSFVSCTNNGWGWSYSAAGAQLVAPITVRVSSGSKQVTATVSAITPNLVADTNGQL